MDLYAPRSNNVAPETFERSIAEIQATIPHNRGLQGDHEASRLTEKSLALFTWLPLAQNYGSATTGS